MAGAVRISAVGGSSTGTADRTATITPASGDLLVVYCCVAANANDTPTCSDNNGSGTYDRIDVLNFAIAAVNYRLSVFIRTALMVNTTSTVVTVATGSNTSGAVHVLAMTGITRTGLDAVRSKGSQNNQAAATAAPTLNQAALTGNPTLVAHGSADTTTTPPTNWTEIQDTNFSNDTVALETAFRASGFTGTTITFGAASSTQFASHAMELDITVAPVPLTQPASDSVNSLADFPALGYGNLHADSVATLADALQLTLGHAVNVDDTVDNLADGAVKVVGVIAMLADTLATLADAQAQLLAYLLALADTAAANWADAHDLLLSQRLALADDAANAADAAVVELTYLAGFSDSLSVLTDAESHDLAAVVTADDSIDNLTDAVELQLNCRLQFSDPSAEFPATGILDDFNRANEGPPPSSNWTSGVANFGGIFGSGHMVSSNQITNDLAATAQDYWNAAQFGPDCEAYVTVVDGTDLLSMALAARLTNIGRFTTNGYVVQIGPSGPSGANRTYYIYRLDSGNLSLITTTTESGVGSITADKYGIRCTGSTVELLGDTGDGWSIKLSATDSTYSGAGYVGVVSETDNVSKFDDFGGGTVASAGLQDALAFSLLGPVGIQVELSDVLVLTDSFTVGHGLLAADTLPLADVLELRSNSTLIAVDSLVLSDAESHVLDQFEALADDANLLADSPAVQLGQLQSFTDTLDLADTTALGFGLVLTDGPLVLSDDLAQQLNAVTAVVELAVADSFTLSDSPTLGYGLSHVDAVVLSDGAAAALGHQVEFADSLTIADVVALQLGHLTTFADSLTLTDSESAVLGYREALVDSLTTLADVEVHQLEQRLTFSDSVDSLSELLTLTLGEVLSPSDTLAHADSLAVGYGLAITDNANFLLDDIVTSAPQGPLRQVGVTDALDALADETALKLDHLLAVADSAATLTDAVQLLEGLRATFTDSFTLTDAATVNLDHRLSTADSLALTDSVQLRLDYHLSTSDTLLLMDSATQALSHRLALTDNAALLADSTTQTIGLAVIIADNGPTLSDAIVLFSAWLLQFADALTLTDSPAKFGAGFLSLDDTLIITDSAIVELRGPDLSASPADTLTLTDAIALTLNNELPLQLQLVDTVTLTDHYFDLRHPYTPSAKRHIVVPSRARTTVPVRQQGIEVPRSDRTTEIE